MALADVQAIIQALSNYSQHQLQNRQLEQEQERIESEKDYRKAEADRFNKDLALREKQFGAEQDLQQINRQILAQKVAENYVNTGILPLNAASAPVGGAPSTPNIPALGLSGSPEVPATHSIVSIPGVGDMMLPTPEFAAQQQAERQRILNAPAEEARTREQTAQQQAETNRQLQVAAQETKARTDYLASEHKNRLAELAQQNTYETNRQNNQIAAQRALEGIRLGNQLTVARINASGGLFGMDAGNPFTSTGVHIVSDENGQPQVKPVQATSIFQNASDDALNLRLTSDEFKKRYGKQAIPLMNYLRSNNLGLLDKNDNDMVKDLNTAAQVAPQLKEMVLLRAQYPTQVFIPGTDAYKMYQKDYDLISKNIPAMSRIFSGVKRFNEQEFDKYLDGMIPRRNPLASNPAVGFDKYNDFITTLQNAYNTATSSLPKQHQDVARQNLGLNSLPYLNKAMTQPGQPTEAPAGATPALPLQNGGKIKVIRKSDMSQGFISPQFYNPDIYIKAPAGQ